MTKRVAVHTGEKISAYIGRCVKCRKTYRWDIPAEHQTSNPYWLPSGVARPWCPCRAGVACQDPTHTLRSGALLEDGSGHDHPHTAINFKPLGVTYVESKRCDRSCEGASSAKCACSCGGANHGRVHALDAAGVM